jgi:hypothetical protein
MLATLGDRTKPSARRKVKRLQPLRLASGKTKRSTLMKTLILAVVIVAAVAVSSANAVPTPFTITLTEISSTNLTATYDGTGGNGVFSVVNNNPDVWTVTFSSATLSLSPFVFDWTEPENSQEVNEVSHGIAFGNSNNLYVTSDESLMEYGGDASTLNNDNTPVLVGTDGIHPVFLTFHDVAGASENGTSVPDRGSTLGLLALSVAGLAGLSRFRRQLV